AWSTGHVLMAIAAGVVLSGVAVVALIARQDPADPSTAGGGAQANPTWWTFTTPDSPGMTRVAGSWRHDARGGTDDGGSMVIESDDFMAVFDVADGSLPLRLSIQCRPLLPMTADGQPWLRIYPDGADLAVFGNVGRVKDIDQATFDATTLFEKTVLVSDDSLDWWSDGARTSLIFYRRARPTTRWILAAHGRWRIDDLRIDRIEAGALPDIGTYREALAAIPLGDRYEDHDLAGLRGLDPDKPVTLGFVTADQVGAPPVR
nr:hypothetical protein [Planctomycetota bacterium]